MEQDFGVYEGKKWYERQAGPGKSGRDSHRTDHADSTGFIDVESKDSMALRMDTFLHEYLLPLFDGLTSNEHVIAIVSHGMILSTLWRRLLSRLPPKSVSFSPELLATTRVYSLEHLGGWGNTGYLQLELEHRSVPGPIVDETDVSHGEVVLEIESKAAPGTIDQLIGKTGFIEYGDPIIDSASLSSKAVTSTFAAPKLLYGWTTTILVINGRDHLQGLKRTRGGVGSARHDEKQKSIETFFKRRKSG